MTEAEQLATRWGVPVAIAMMAVGVRFLFSADRLTLIGIARGIAVGLFVGALANLYLADLPEMTDGARGACVGVAAVVAEDLLVGLMRVAKLLREDPARFLEFIINRGKK
jgi:hypothetical protein